MDPLATTLGLGTVGGAGGCWGRHHGKVVSGASTRLTRYGSAQAKLGEIHLGDLKKTHFAGKWVKGATGVGSTKYVWRGEQSPRSNDYKQKLSKIQSSGPEQGEGCQSENRHWE